MKLFSKKSEEEKKSQTKDAPVLFTKKRFKKWLKIVLFLGVGVAAIMFVGGTLLMISLSDELPDPNQLASHSVYQSTKIYDKSGQHLLHEFYQDEKRTLVKLDDISPWMKKAVVAVEDKEFYNHKGVRVVSILRGGFNKLIGRTRGAGGGSTITQQLIKNVIVGSERKGLGLLLRKAKEMLLAIKAEQQFSKEEILQMYLNEVPFGSTNYGIESASQSYFQKSSRDLTLAESATLAGLIQRPSKFLNDLESLKNRRDVVLQLMFEQNYISETERDEAKKLPLALNRGGGTLEAPHFVFYVQDELETILGEKEVATGGYRVFTTLDYDKQKSAEKIVKENGDKFAKENNANNAALVAIDPKTGNILSMIGSRDYYNDEIDGQFNVILSKRQPGSSFKPFVYLAAFEKGYTPNTVLYDIQVDFSLGRGRPFKPGNAGASVKDPKNNGLITMKKALQGSLNIPAVKTMYLIGGLKPTVEFAKRFGYTTLKEDGDYGLSLVIGGAEIMPLEHTAAYASLANNGTYIPPHSILEVENANGEVIYARKEESGTQTVSPELANTMTGILSNNQLRAFIFGTKNNLTLPDRPVAAKTGTTNDNKDAWTMGYVPSLSVGVWVGNTIPSPMKGGGEKLAGIIWNQFMREALKDTKPELFPPAPAETSSLKPVLNGKDGGLKLKINSINGKLATSSTPPNLIIEKEFLPPHDILHYVDKNDPGGPEPLNPQDDPQYNGWESSLQKWIKEKQEKGELISTDPPPTEYDDMGAVSENGSISLEIISPSHQEVVSSNIIEIKISATAERGISQANFSIDGNTVGSSSQAPFYFNYDASKTTKGEHKLRVAVVDDIGNYAVREVTFIFGNDNSNPTFEWFDLSPLVLSQKDFPREMFLNITNWEKIKDIQIFLTPSAGDKRLVYTIDKNDPISQNKVYFTWKKTPDKGKYTLLGRMTSADGQIIEKELKIEIQ